MNGIWLPLDVAVGRVRPTRLGPYKQAVSQGAAAFFRRAYENIGQGQPADLAEQL